MHSRAIDIVISRYRIPEAPDHGASALPPRIFSSRALLPISSSLLCFSVGISDSRLQVRQDPFFLGCKLPGVRGCCFNPRTVDSLQCEKQIGMQNKTVKRLSSLHSEPQISRGCKIAADVIHLFETIPPKDWTGSTGC